MNILKIDDIHLLMSKLEPNFMVFFFKNRKEFLHIYRISSVQDYFNKMMHMYTLWQKIKI